MCLAKPHGNSVKAGVCHRRMTYPVALCVTKSAEKPRHSCRGGRPDGRHGSSGGGAIRRRGQRRGVNPHGAQRWSAACWGRWHRSALYRWRGRADDRRRHTQYQQHLDNLRRKGLLPRLKNDRSTCLLGWLFCLELCRFCLSCGVGRPLRCATPRPIRLPWSGSRLRAPTRAPCSRCDITVGWGLVSPSGARRTAVRADGCAAHCPF